MKVAVLMPAYNAEPYIELSLRSILAQRDAAQFDIIVVNDGSTDGTGDVVRKLMAEAPEIRLIEQENKKIAPTRNVLLDTIAPDTDVVTWLDADDLSPPGRFARDLQFFESDPELDLLYGYLRAYRGDCPDPMHPGPDVKWVDVRGIQLGCMLARPRLLKRVGSFDETLIQAEDTDYLFRVIELRPKMVLSDEVAYFYRRHGTSISSVHRKDSSGYFNRAVFNSLRRRRQGAPPVPPGFFDGHNVVGRLDWW